MSAEATQVITASEVRQAATERKSLVEKFAARYGIEPNRMMATLRATVIRPARDGTEATNEQIASFLIVANQHDLNPFTKEIHAFLGARGGIVCVVGLDGWAKKINEHQQFDGMTFEQDDEKCTCTMYRKDRKYPTVHTEYLAECKRPTEPWNTHPKRMLKWKALIQAARIAFSFAGVYDPDEAEQIIAAEAIDVTPVKIGPKKLREIIDGMLAAVKAENAAALQKIYSSLSSDEQLFVWEHLRSWERSAIKRLQGAKVAPDGPGLVPWSVEAIKASKDHEALQATWRLVQDAFAEADLEVPADVETVYLDRKAELGA